jgi:preprotein translocase subunit SecY
VKAELGGRIAFTLGALIVYRIGTYIPLPGLDPAALQEVFRIHPGGTSAGGSRRAVNVAS